MFFSKGGFYILSLINEYVAGYPLLIVGILQVIVVPWIYGTDQLIKDIEAMIGPKPRSFWYIWIISWKFVTPLVLIVINQREIKCLFCLFLLIFLYFNRL
jgi:SNF family Na+-dependent transporter